MKRIMVALQIGFCTAGVLTGCGKRQDAPVAPQSQTTVNNTSAIQVQNTTTINNPLAQPSGTSSPISQITPGAGEPPLPPAQTLASATSSSTRENPQPSLSSSTSQPASAAVVVAPQPAAVVLPGAAPAATGGVRLTARSGSRIRIEGTSSIHDWQVESPLIGGYIDVSGNFPIQPAASIPTGPISVSGEAFVTVRSLKSVQRDGKPYSDKMDDIMYEKLLVSQHPRIVFRPLSLSPSPTPPEAKTYNFDGSGQLQVAGVTKDVRFPVTVAPQADGKLRISGVATLKMTDFNIQPPAPLGMVIKTGDEVKVLFSWVVAPKT